MYRTQVVCLAADALYALKGGGFGSEVGEKGRRIFS